MANLLPQIEILTQLVAWVKSLFVQPDYAQNDSTQPDYIKNRTHYVESVSTSSVWYQTNVEVGSASSSPGAYSGTFNLTEGKTYNVTITQGSNTKTYEGIVAENNTFLNGMFLNKNWSNPIYGAETTSDAFYILVQASSVILAGADVYGSNCTVQVSEVTETIHKLDPKYLPDNVNQLEDVTTSKSGKVTTVTFEQTNGTQTQFQVTDGADGTNGKSAYQVAVDNGYSGSEAQWLASLKGADGVSLGEVELTQEVTTATDSVPANKAVYDKVQRVDIENSNKSDYNDNQWLQDQGWKLDYRLFQNSETAASGYCISLMFPFVYGHTYTFSYQFNASNNCTFSFFTDEGVYKEYYSCNANNVRTVTASASSLSSCTQMRGTFSLSNIRQCYIHDDTTNEYIFKGDEYLDSLTAKSNKEFDNLIDYKTYRDELLVQELNQSTTQVPSAKAVQDGIEVWRDDIDYIYKANDLTFDGTNYVDTGWNPYNTDSNFEIRMQISDLLLDSMSNSDTIISCIKQVSPYPGFSIRRGGATKLEVYINGGAKMATVANKDVGSVNTIIFKRVGNVYTFTLNETSTSYTYPSNGVDNSGANTLHIGASLDANDAPFRYGKFKLDYIRVATNVDGFEHNVQLYGDYKKHDKIYPKVSVDGIRIPEYFSGRWVEFELNDYPSRNLNPLSADGITLVYDYRYVGGNPSMGTLFQFIGVTTTQDQLTIGTAAHQFRLTIAKNGTTQSVVLSNTGISTLACLIIVTMDFVNGVCKFYRNGDFFVSKTFDTTLLPESSNIKRVIVETENSGDLTYRTKKFMTVINGCLDGDTIQKMWDSYPLDIYPSSLCTYEFSKHIDVDMSNINVMGQGSGVQTSDKTASSVVCSGEYATNMHIYKSSLFGSYEMSHYCKYYGKIKVTEGTITFTGLGIRGSVKINVYNATDDTWLGNNNVILPIGEYYFNGDAILNDSANIFRFTSSSSFSFIFSNFKMERIGAVLNLSPYTYFNNTFELFGGEKIPVGSNFVKYFDTYKIPITYSESNPSYSGQLKMADDNVYVGYIKGGTATWKQINNS